MDSQTAATRNSSTMLNKAYRGLAILEFCYGYKRGCGVHRSIKYFVGPRKYECASREEGLGESTKFPQAHPCELRAGKIGPA